MIAPQDWVIEKIDTSCPNIARVYDYLLGGACNFAVDRDFAKTVLTKVPGNIFARHNRAFLYRVVRYLVIEAGIRQFVDLGSGLPTMGNVHQVAQAIRPDCAVVYVDHDPVAVAHSQRMLRDNRRAAIVRADIRSPKAILTSTEMRRLIDFQKPVAVLLCAVLHFIDDTDDPAGLVAAYRDAICPGSYLVISHGTTDGCPTDMTDVIRMYRDSQRAGTPRTRQQITALLDGLTLVTPGVVFTPQWRAEPDADPDYGDPRRSLCYAAVGYKP